MSRRAVSAECAGLWFFWAPFGSVRLGFASDGQPYTYAVPTGGSVGKLQKSEHHPQPAATNAQLAEAREAPSALLMTNAAQSPRWRNGYRGAELREAPTFCRHSERLIAFIFFLLRKVRTSHLAIAQNSRPHPTPPSHTPDGSSTPCTCTCTPFALTPLPLSPLLPQSSSLRARQVQITKASSQTKPTSPGIPAPLHLAPPDLALSHTSQNRDISVTVGAQSYKMSTTTTTSTFTAPHTQQPLRLAVQKKKMSITQTYYLAHKARAKLSSEAARADHDLRLLVGHANLLDSLMLELADAEREQESWFNQSVRGATKDRHIQWADSIAEDSEDLYEDDSDDSDDSSVSSDDDYEEDDIEMADTVSLRRMPSAAPASPRTSTIEVSEDYDMEEDDLEEDYAQLELVRTPSHSSSSSPPELEHEHDSDISDDESMPPSPPNAVLTFNEKEAKEEISQQQSQQGDGTFYSEGYYLPARNPARLVSAISVY
ncbi:hypothetical protein CCUS01_09340 [Colletotrichum cuscutae]|uniref:Uncharacterized protein n=1 Tax=Colletotrichum cuscutae TaxID=1209917 RepID=A0AAI9UKY7_9PEZI|nr:hypothetical protein CCUS01_09340 [Colletotrichum cuscutae]